MVGSYGTAPVSPGPRPRQRGLGPVRMAGHQLRRYQAGPAGLVSLIAVTACGEGADGRLHGGDGGDFLAVGEAYLTGRVSADRHGGDVGVGGSGEGEGWEQGDRQAGGNKVLNDDVVVGGVADIGLEAGGAGERLEVGAAAEAAGDPALARQVGQVERCAD